MFLYAANLHENIHLLADFDGAALAGQELDRVHSPGSSEQAGADTESGTTNEFIDPTLGKEGAVSPAIRQNTAPVLLSSEQKRQVEQLQWDFPLSRGSFGNEDYIAAPTRGNASDFIVGAMEGNHDAATKKENGISYIASRPRARRTVPTLCSPDRMRR